MINLKEPLLWPLLWFATVSVTIGAIMGVVIVLTCGWMKGEL